LPQEYSLSCPIVLTDTSIIHKLQAVLRLRKGDSVCFFNGTGKECSARIEALHKKEMSFAVEDVINAAPSAAVPRITLAVAFIKEQRLEVAIEKATELGVDTFVLFPAAQSVKSNITESRLSRLRKIAQEASRQSERAMVPALRVAESFETMVAGFSAVPGKFFLECRDEKAPGVQRPQLQTQEIAVVVGPEGDFTAGEKKVLTAHAFVPVHLPLPVLRSETAALFAVGWLRCLAATV